MTTILDRIVATKHQEIETARENVSLHELTRSLESLPPCRDFFSALMKPTTIQLIAEVKKASPSKGVIRDDFDPVKIADAYESGGASCLSVLTDEQYFQGSLAYMTAVKNAVEIPVLRKDFIIDEYQIVEARAAGADAILLIAECLSPKRLDELYCYARSFGLQVLMELYDLDNLSSVLNTGCPIVGINNRDLRTFEVDLDRTLRLREMIPNDRCVVGESGIFTAEHARTLLNGGVNAMLVGESLMRQDDIERAVRELLSVNEHP